MVDSEVKFRLAEWATYSFCEMIGSLQPPTNNFKSRLRILFSSEFLKPSCTGDFSVVWLPALCPTSVGFSLPFLHPSLLCSHFHSAQKVHILFTLLVPVIQLSSKLDAMSPFANLKLNKSCSENDFSFNWIASYCKRILWFYTIFYFCLLHRGKTEQLWNVVKRLRVALALDRSVLEP